ncbi:MAG TPA: cytochrome d ubiquinol oxidase subunit II [Anaeromyxobacteraceae bacterium]|nr:cytochrome d ubiquinol oxidase subunit II [Anaeromyxobacteraceae bacterium]
MTPAILLAGAMVAALVAYVLLGGADFGGGIWDLIASGPRQRSQRALIERAIGPIWEANHVWLILVIVLLFAGFPRAFAAISTGLFMPLVILLVGIVLRGAAFTFRAYDDRGDAARERWGLAFSASSAGAPLILGLAVGALAAGKVGARVFSSPFAISSGFLAVVLFAFLAANYLAVEAAGSLREDFRHRALACGFVLFFVAAATAVLAKNEAPLVFHGLTGRKWSLPLHVATGTAAVVALLSLARRRLRVARSAAVVQSALIVLGWAASQYPYLVVPSVTIESAGAPRNVQVALLGALAVGAFTLFPSLWLLFRVFKGKRPLAFTDSLFSRRSQLKNGS